MKLVASRRADGHIELRSVGVGYYRRSLRKGDLVGPGQSAGEFESLGHREDLSIPAGTSGRVVEVAGHRRAPAMFGEVLVVLDPSAGGAAVDAAAEDVAASTGLVFRSPMSGRFYLRPGPGEPPFVSAGDEVRRGQAVALLEVMKTFNRVPFGGDDLPESAIVKRVVPADGADVEAGDVLLELAD